MEDLLVLQKSGVSSHTIKETKTDTGKSSNNRSGFSPAIETLVEEDNGNIFLYLKRLQLSPGSDILVLPSNNHYYYEEKELKDIKVLINLKKLNLIKHLDMFLDALVRILPSNARFIGCFSDNNTVKEDEFSPYHYSRLFNRFLNLLDSKTDHIMNKTKVSGLLEKYGFKTIDMKEMNGLTYFYCKTSGNMYN